MLSVASAIARGTALGAIAQAKKPCTARADANNLSKSGNNFPTFEMLQEREMQQRRPELVRQLATLTLGQLQP